MNVFSFQKFAITFYSEILIRIKNLQVSGFGEGKGDLRRSLPVSIRLRGEFEQRHGRVHEKLLRQCDEDQRGEREEKWVSLFWE